MSKKNSSHQHDIEDLKKQNGVLEQQVRGLEKAKAAGTFAAAHSVPLDSTASEKLRSGGKDGLKTDPDYDSSDSDTEIKQSKRKKMKT